MGTSSSYGGPRGPGGLLPPWLDDDAPPPGPDPALPQPSWRGPKVILGRLARTGGTPSPAGLRSLGRSYVRANGGSARAAAGASAGRAMTGRLAAFVAGVASDGVVATLVRLGLERLIGADAGTVIAALTDWLGQDGALLEEVAARDAAIQTMTDLAERCALYEEGVDGFTRLGADDLGAVVELSIANYLDARLQRDLIRQIERGTLSDGEAVQLMEEIRSFILADVRLTLEVSDPLAIDWQGAEGRALVRQLYARAYAVLGGE